jgi:lipoprotein-anchoring transpeptidase ErfK/SrfK
LREVIGQAPAGVFSRRWIETPKGYVYAPGVQPVKNLPNKPVLALPDSGSLGKGMWVEVTIPYVDIILEKPANSFWLKSIQHPRLYYSQTMWVDDVRTSSQGQILYHVTEKFGLDSFWCAAEAFRPITIEELKPIHQEAENKLVVVDLNHQVLSCYEGNQEVYVCRISSGGKFNANGDPVDTWATPLGDHFIWRKAISFHMQSGSAEAGWDTMGVPWTSLFVGEGVAIHSVFWHNDFGTPRSHGCVNASPEDAKFVFRWTVPTVNFDPGDLTTQLPAPSTVVRVIEA